MVRSSVETKHIYTYIYRVFSCYISIDADECYYIYSYWLVLGDAHIRHLPGYVIGSVLFSAMVIKYQWYPNVSTIQTKTHIILLHVLLKCRLMVICSGLSVFLIHRDPNKHILCNHVSSSRNNLDKPSNFLTAVAVAHLKTNYQCEWRTTWQVSNTLVCINCILDTLSVF